MRALASVLLLVLALCASGCAVAPPPELDVAPVASGASPLAGLTLALAPLSTSYLRGQDALFASGAAVTSSGAVARGERSPYGWATPPADADELQAHFARLLGRSLGVEVTRLGRGSVGAVTSGASGRAALEAAACDAADQKSARLLAHVDLLENHVAWKSRRLLLWVPDLLLLWGWGMLPVTLVPDEWYEAHVRARVTVAHARTREVLFRGEYEGSVEMALNTFERGLTLSGLVGLHPYFLSAESGDFEPSHQALFPHALRSLDGQLARALPVALAEALAVPGVLERVHDGTPATARTWAVVLGHDGPRTTEPRPPLRFASNDAEALGEALLRSGVVGSRDHLRVLTEQGATHATKAELFAAIDALVERMLGLDRLIIYYAGYGRTTEAGEPVLVLGGGDDEVRLSELAERTGKAVLAGERPRVLFLLDTSFGREPVGRNYRAQDDPGRAADPATHLEPLANRALGWTVISAAGASEAAHEVDARDPRSRHGFFTQRLLAALTDLRGELTTESLARSLIELVPEDVRALEQAEQTPERRGLEEPTPLEPAR